MNDKRLKDKVIVISGGTKGVGRAFAEVAGGRLHGRLEGHGESRLTGQGARDWPFKL